MLKIFGTVDSCPLQVDPYLVETWWRLGVFEPYSRGDAEPMLRVLR